MPSRKARALALPMSLAVVTTVFMFRGYLSSEQPYLNKNKLAQYTKSFRVNRDQDKSLNTLLFQLENEDKASLHAIGVSKKSVLDVLAARLNLILIVSPDLIIELESDINHSCSRCPLDNIMASILGKIPFRLETVNNGEEKSKLCIGQQACLNKTKIVDEREMSEANFFVSQDIETYPEHSRLHPVFERRDLRENFYAETAENRAAILPSLDPAKGDTDFIIDALLYDPSPSVRRLAAEVLFFEVNNQTTDAYLRALHDNDEQVVKLALNALAEQKDYREYVVAELQERESSGIRLTMQELGYFE